MGKKRKKKKRKKNRYNKDEFLDIVCGSCEMCSGDPSFCYGIAYKENAKLFMEKIYPKLLGFKGDLCKAGEEEKAADLFSRLRFSKIFCKSEICGHQIGSGHCQSMEECYQSFLEQLTAPTKRKSGKVKKKQTIVKPYATFFISDNEAFRKEIGAILHGD